MLLKKPVYKENRDSFIINPVVSKTHTYVSKLVSEHHHSKNNVGSNLIEFFERVRK
jgi:hypothetical protein